jgi:hypothetical protein
MKKSQKESFELLPIPDLHFGNGDRKAKEMTDANQESTRMSVEIHFELMEKIKDFAYWHGLTQQQIAIQALETWLTGKTIKARPELVKNRIKVGRKRKT